MDFPRPQRYYAKLASREYISPSKKFLSVKLELPDADSFLFRAGQYISVKIDESGERRAYSIANIPSPGSTEIELVTDITPEGHGTEFLKEVPVGETVDILAPLGRFVMSEKGEPTAIFIATGSGIVPLKSMIEDALLRRDEKRRIILYWGLRHEEDLFWQDIFEAFQKNYPNFQFRLCISQPIDTQKFQCRRVTELIEKDHDRISDMEAYICGNQGMIMQMRELLGSKGMDAKHMYQEQFY